MTETFRYVMLVICGLFCVGLLTGLGFWSAHKMLKLNETTIIIGKTDEWEE